MVRQERPLVEGRQPTRAEEVPHRGLHPGPLVPVVVCATADVDLAMTYRDLGVRIERVGTIPW